MLFNDVIAAEISRMRKKLKTFKMVTDCPVTLHARVPAADR